MRRKGKPDRKHRVALPLALTHRKPRCSPGLLRPPGARVAPQEAVVGWVKADKPQLGFLCRFSSGIIVINKLTAQGRRRVLQGMAHGYQHACGERAERDQRSCPNPAETKNSFGFRKQVKNSPKNPKKDPKISRTGCAVLSQHLQDTCSPQLQPGQPRGRGCEPKWPSISSALLQPPPAHGCQNLCSQTHSPQIVSFCREKSLGSPTGSEGLSGWLGPGV